MAKTLLAAGQFPNVRVVPWTFAPPGDGHHDLDVENIVKGQHWAMGYLSKCHVSQAWEADRIRDLAAAGFVTKLTYIIYPRLAASNGLEWRFYARATGGSGLIRVQCVETATGTNTTINSGAASFYVNTLALNRPDQQTTIEVQLDANLGTKVELLAFGLWDFDLTSGTLP